MASGYEKSPDYPGSSLKSRTAYAVILAGIGAGIGSIIGVSFWFDYAWVTTVLGGLIGCLVGDWLVNKRQTA